jgi:hypothetical protein
MLSRVFCAAVIHAANRGDNDLGQISLMFRGCVHPTLLYLPPISHDDKCSRQCSLNMGELPTN